MLLLGPISPVRCHWFVRYIIIITAVTRRKYMRPRQTSWWVSRLVGDGRCSWSQVPASLWKKKRLFSSSTHHSHSVLHHNKMGPQPPMHMILVHQVPAIIWIECLPTYRTPYIADRLARLPQSLPHFKHSRVVIITHQLLGKYTYWCWGL